MFAPDEFTEAAPRYPERVTVHAPRGTRSSLMRAAEREKTTPADLMRRILAEKVSELAGGEPDRDGSLKWAR
jgi:hypothetical protein